jgi:6-phosphogluconolactonase (cycloisomerase 2 family)
MRALNRFAAAAATAGAALAVSAAGAGAATATTPQPEHQGGFAQAAGAVFVQTDNLSGNQIVAYSRAANGTLTEAGIYPTGGLGGELQGSVVDHLASQASLVYDRQAGLLFSVNAASNTISVFAVSGDRLALRQVISSGGTFPVSIAVQGPLLYVLNAENGGSVQGFAVAFGRLFALSGTSRPLGLNPAAEPQFVNTPGQVAFSPNGSQLIVTTKANGSDIDVFHIGFLGRLSATPVVNSEPGAVPFSLAFDQAGNLLVTEAGPNALASFKLSADGTVTQLDTVATGDKATCWITEADGRFYLSNAGSGALSGFTSSPGGQLTLLGEQATDGGTVDTSASSDGRFLYVQTGATGIVDEFAIAPNGALNEVGTVTVPGAVGGEGIVAS